MTISRTRAENVQEEPGASYSKKVLKQTNTHKVGMSKRHKGQLKEPPILYKAGTF